VPKSEDPIAWLGCWDALADPEADSTVSLEERQKICVAPGDAPQILDMTVLVDDEIVAKETIVTDGSRQPVSDGGCDGWIRSVLSEDRRRLYLQSEATCPDGKLRNLTGASMIVSENRWIDIHALRIDGDRELLIQRYRPVEVGIVRLPGALPTEMHAVRMAAAAPLSVENVSEALQFVDPAVVEAMLLESDASFGIDSDLLLYLDRAGIPSEIIDLMVALSFPDYFTVEDGSINRQPEVYYGGYWATKTEAARSSADAVTSACSRPKIPPAASAASFKGIPTPVEASAWAPGTAVETPALRVAPVTRAATRVRTARRYRKSVNECVESAFVFNRYGMTI
jgi:hypothetical protein